MAKKQTHVALVLDSSGSMGSMKDAAIELFNAQADTVHDARKKGGKTRVSFVLFGETDPTVRLAFKNRRTKDVPRLNADTYNPQAMTPMRDGIGLAIETLAKRDDGGDDTAFLVVVVTDGMENASSEWSAERLSARVNELQATGRWTFAVYGSNISLADLQKSGINIEPGNFMAYKPTPAGLMDVSFCVNAATDSYMGSRQAGVTATTDFTKTKTKPKSA